ncbi:MAG: alpha/beta fold hydrolase [Actinomycetia bacterium]|nr:alpha/beta fold hydrolase [Actinomycetes bacterium]
MGLHRLISCAYFTVLPFLALLLSAGQSCGASGVESREIAFQSAGYRLLGTLTSPAHRAAFASVLIMPGSGPTDRNGVSRFTPSAPQVYRLWAERLSEAGFAVIRYDKRFLTHPDIDIPSFDQEAQIADALSAVAFLRSALPQKRVFLVGHSEGGTLATVVSERTGNIAGLAVINSAQFPVDELIVAQLQANPTVPRSTVEEVKDLLMKIKDGSFPKRGVLLGVGAEYWMQWIRYSQHSRAMLSELSIPVLLVQCLADDTLPGETLGRNLENLRAVVALNKNALLRELRAHDHFGMLPGGRDPSPEFTRVLLDWLNNAGRAAQPSAPADAPQVARR